MALQGMADAQENGSWVERDAATATKRREFFAFLGALNDQCLLAPSDLVEVAIHDRRPSNDPDLWPTRPRWPTETAGAERRFDEESRPR